MAGQRNLVYVVHAKKYGLDDSHSYIVGVYKSKRKAIAEANAEEELRGAPKFLCEVSEWVLGTQAGTVVREVGRERFPHHFGPIEKVLP